MFLPFRLRIDSRLGTASKLTCPLHEKPDETGEIYGKLVRTWTMENGSYDETWEYPSNDYDDGTDSCPAAEYSTTADPEIDYGGVISSSDDFTLPMTVASVRGALDSAATDWDDWNAVITYSRDGGEELLFTLFDDIGLEIGSTSQLTQLGSIGGGMAVIQGDRTDYEVRFTLEIPLACQVVYQFGEKAYDDPGDYTFGDEETVNVLPGSPVTLTIPTAEGFLKRLKIVRLRPHPWAV